MSKEEKDGLGLPPIGGIVIVLIAIGAIWFSFPNLKSSRPGEKGIPTQVVDLEDVSARLWQDPFGPAYKHEGHKSKQDSIHSHYALTKMIAGEDKKRSGPEAIHIIGVMVEGGHYFENVEQKRRRRYAVVSALNVSGYKPENAQRIGYILADDHKATNGYNLDLPEKIPFELFIYNKKEETSQAKPLIVLLWLDEEFFGSDFLTKINALTEVLHLKGTNSEQERREQAKFTILGPASSTTLKSMAEDLGNTNKKNKWNNLQKLDFTILSPTATAENKFLMENVESYEKNIGELFKNTFPDGRFLRTIKSDYALGGRIYDELTLRGVKPGKDHIVFISEWDTNYGSWLPRSLEKAFKHRYSESRFIECIRKYVRTISDEIRKRSEVIGRKQVKTILGEIKEKSEEFEYKIIDDIVYEREFSEGEVNELIVKRGNNFTNYVIELLEIYNTDNIEKTINEAGKEFETAIRKIEIRNKEFSDETITRYSYIRGLDGHVSDSLTDTETTQLSYIKNNQKTEKDNRRSWNETDTSRGNGQFDYLERIGGKIQEKNSELRRESDGRIKAIGVLGSDAYDKLLVLQALRKSFPGVIFFTTDLDARLSDKNEMRWTRNLIVSSNFGLSLHPDLQKNIPPFRDNYQTSVYLTTLLALNTDVKSSQYTPKQDQMYSLIRPKIFEIGRHHPCELLSGKESTINSANVNPMLEILYKSIKNSNGDMKNSIYPTSPTYIPDSNRIYLLFYSVMFGAILVVAVVVKNKGKILPLILFPGYGVFILLCYYSYNGYFDKGYWLEPFTLFEGVSIWPAELLKIVSIICCGLFLYLGSKRLKENIVELGEKYFGDKKDDSLLTEKNKSHFPINSVLFILLTSFACYLFLWDLFNGTWGAMYNLLWIVPTSGFFIWRIVDYLDKIAPSRDKRGKEGDERKASDTRNPTQVKKYSSGQNKTARVMSNMFANPQIIAIVIILSVIISICLLLSWKYLDKYLGVYFYVIWVIPIGLLGWLILKHLDTFAIARKRNGTRGGEDKYKNMANSVWSSYCFYGETQNRYFRTSVIVISFFFFSVFIMKLFGELHVPYRGYMSKYIDMTITYISFLLFVVLLFYVVDAAGLCVRFVRLIMNEQRTCSGETKSKFGVISSIDDVATDHWLKIKLIAERTASVNTLTNYPIWVILFIVVSYITYFDNWYVPVSLYLLFGISLVIPILCSYLLHREAMAAKDTALEVLNKELMKETTKLFSGHQKKIINQINLFIREVKGIQKGAFVPFFQQPFVRSIVYLLGIIGALLGQYYSHR
ncbi:MAG: hypothetical protein D8M57_16095 [Candidatus Scalindua sp. AMX11]|nr:MAG: hypothetical protein DWQ00_03570 [Candidatus Scalindua sp.]NOG82795.1 hypothetical protein [Planctomycetota bacterium]RZV69023.1 MAG: hypothetical protein EX341_16260 [Candidatus Scalindua sp. SCAELEC01]TDE63854.1 MAG: hypothetical protein D8M57_16095 [Candidatus Scalindua sp. AMX11]GJQ60433.1 MAG: hypothetical protein SCALA701_32340 [Candidatus Scalindua sp.]